MWGPLLALAAAAAGCEPFDPIDEPRAQSQAEARAAFELWLDACAQGKAETAFQYISSSNKSQWLFERLREEDALARDWRARLTGTARTDLDLWLEHSRRNPRTRVETMPISVLAHPSLQDLWKAYFALERDAIRRQLTQVEIADVYSDETGVSILVRNSIGRREMYQMIREADGWRIDHQKTGFGPFGR